MLEENVHKINLSDSALKMTIKNKKNGSLKESISNSMEFIDSIN